MNDALLMELAHKARTDKSFRRAALEDLEGALRAHGYTLAEDELEAARSFHNQVKDMSDDELERFLSSEVSAHG